MLQLAVHFYEQGHYSTDQLAKPGSQRKLKRHGYQVSKANYQILKALIPNQVTDIPRSRIVEYRYIQVDDVVQQQSHYFLLPIAQTQLPQIEAITQTERQPRVYLWRDETWWSFPQLETYSDGEMATYTVTVRDYGPLSALHSDPPAVRTETRQVEKTKLRLRPTYEPAQGPGFALTHTAPNHPPDAPVNLPATITGNGMVLEWKRGYEDKHPCCCCAMSNGSAKPSRPLTATMPPSRASRTSVGATLSGHGIFWGDHCHRNAGWNWSVMPP
jgi:hypothetical protein